MRVIILGGSGFIGRALTQALISRGDEVVVPTRHVPAATPSTGPEYQLWDGQDHSSLSQLLNGADAVINLLGENIAAKRWSSVQKERIISSRLLAGQALVIALQMPMELSRLSDVRFMLHRGQDLRRKMTKARADIIILFCSQRMIKVMPIL